MEPRELLRFGARTQYSSRVLRIQLSGPLNVVSASLTMLNTASPLNLGGRTVLVSIFYSGFI